MVLHVTSHITEEDVRTIRNSADMEIIVDLHGVNFLTSIEISRLFLIHEDGKSITIKNANPHILETLRILKVDEILTILS